MKKGKGESMLIFRLRFVHVLFALVVLCLVMLSFEAPRLFIPSSVFLSRPAILQVLNYDFENRHHQRDLSLKTAKPNTDGPFSDKQYSFAGEIPKRGRIVEDRHSKDLVGSLKRRRASKQHKEFINRKDLDAPGHGYKSLVTSNRSSTLKRREALSDIERAIEEARRVGAEALKEIEAVVKSGNQSMSSSINKKVKFADDCPKMVFVSRDQIQKAGNKMIFPCGLVSGSTLTVIGTPKAAHVEYMPQIARVVEGSPNVFVSQFMLELRGLTTVDNEDPPRILHVNPRLEGDWSEKPVIELNTCYRGQWGIAQRCEGWESPEDEERVDGLLRCEKWVREDWEVQDLKTSWWLSRIIGRSEKSNRVWQYPFHERSLFVLSIRAGWEGYHISVDGRHIASFPYRTGFVLEEATGFTIAGDIDLHSVVATSLPSSHPNLSPEFVVEDAEKWKAPKLLHASVKLFIGILSSSTHFAERMALRKTWLQSKSIKSSDAVARFFVGLHDNRDINIQVRKEADLFGDIVILPFIDHYELVVLKTVAICDYGIRNISARHVMKTDDDTFVRVEAILESIREHRKGVGLYMGNINEFHKPLRAGKWAVTFEEWPEEDYPPYADGAGYIISVDLAKFISSSYERGSLRLFKMEDVSMGLWVVRFNQSHPISYVNSPRFCQWGCIDDYYTAHYQSPRQMLCLWEKLSQGYPECCNM